MHSYETLPEGYREWMKVDLQKNKKLALIVNGIGLIIAVVMAVIGQLIVPIQTLFDMEAGLGMYTLRFVVLLAGMVAYIILHELVHGVVMKHYSRQKPFYGFTGLYAYAGSKCYFDRRSYIVIALAPIVVWGVVLLILNLFAAGSWFWVVYFIQISNVSGAAGDFYVSARFSKMPQDILVNDVGVSMTVYVKE